MCADCIPLAEEHRLRQQRLHDRYAVAPDDPSRIPMSWDDATSAVADYLGSPVDCDPAGAIEAATWWYVPYQWIGCAGFIVGKSSGDVTQLGSGLELEDWLSAYARRREADRG